MRHPLRVMLIRHAEKPVRGEARGINFAGHANADSLTPKGWMRAGALVMVFRSPPENLRHVAVPDALYATGVGPGSESLRPVQTATPLAAALSCTAAVPFVTRYLKNETESLARSLRARSGCVLVVWEHKALAEIVHRLTRGECSPDPWPDDCYDMIWTLDRADTGWRFAASPLGLLPGDAGAAATTNLSRTTS